MEKEPEHLRKLRKNIAILIGMFLGLIVVCTLCVIIALTTPASALSITLADSTLSGNHSIDIIAANGTLLETTYSGQTVALTLADPANDTIIVHYLPQASTGGDRFVERLANVVESPSAMLAAIMGNVDAYMVEIVILLIVLGVLAIFIFGRR